MSKFALLTGTLLYLLFTAAPSLAAWELDNTRSTVNFLSVKNASTAEVHHFGVLAGGIGDDGTAELRIDLGSVDTQIPVRDQRMRELLFETVRFPAATLRASVPDALLAMEPGDSAISELTIEVELHGASKRYPATVVVMAVDDGSLQVILREPLLLSAADFGLESGIETLRGVAGLESISTAVPVTAHLVFTVATE